MVFYRHRPRIAPSYENGCTKCVPFPLLKSKPKLANCGVIGKSGDNSVSNRRVLDCHELLEIYFY